MSARVFSGLYDELKTEIFSRVPAKSVGKFICLSNKWFSVLTSPNFIDKHLLQSPNSLIFTTPHPSYSLHIINPPIENPIISKSLVELGNEKWIGVMGSCNGLVVLLTITKEIFLVNPITFEKLKINLPRLIFVSNISMHGLGYDSAARDYKILMVSNSYTTTLEYSTFTSVDLYSVKSGVWKSVDYSRFEFVRSWNGDSRGVYVNGSIYWYDNYQKLGKIIAFDLTTEEFRIVGIPISDTTDNSLRLFAHQGRLCALCPQWEMGIGKKLDVWEMREYGSWTKVASISNKDYGYMSQIMLYPFCFSRYKDILLEMTDKMAVVNTHEGTMKEVDTDGVRAYYRGDSFVGSLVSIKDI